MPLTRPGAPLWRHPLLAPGYAAVIAFGAVALTSYPVHKNVEHAPAPVLAPVSVAVSAAADATLLQGLTVKIDSHRICVFGASHPVRLARTNPESACTPRQPSTDGPTTLAVERVRVIVTTKGTPDLLPAGTGKVTVSLGKDQLSAGYVDGDSQFTPTQLESKAQVCLDLPKGWRVADAGPRCQTVKDPARDVLFTVEKKP
jgi:hypothetical protein